MNIFAILKRFLMSKSHHEDHRHHEQRHDPPEKKEIINITENIILIEGQHYHKSGTEFKIISHLITIVNDLVKIVDRLTKEKSTNKPIFALTTIINNQKLILMADVKLVVGSPKNGIFTLLDNKTLLPITTATFSNQAVGANSNPEFATFALDAADSNTVVGTPIAAGSGTVVITTDASWTDPGDNSSQTASFSVTKNFTVSPSADGASFDVVFP